MLVLTRKQKETIQIGDNITVTILRLKGQAVRIGIEAPRDVRVVRGELPPQTSESPTTSEIHSEETAAQPEAAPQVVQFRFSPEKPLETAAKGLRGPLASFLTNLHTPGFVAEAVAQN